MESGEHPASQRRHTRQPTAAVACPRAQPQPSAAPRVLQKRIDNLYQNESRFTEWHAAFEHLVNRFKGVGGTFSDEMYLLDTMERLASSRNDQASFLFFAEFLDVLQCHRRCHDGWRAAPWLAFMVRGIYPVLVRRRDEALHLSWLVAALLGSFLARHLRGERSADPVRTLVKGFQRSVGPGDPTRTAAICRIFRTTALTISIAVEFLW